MMKKQTQTADFDIIIVGAGLSGIGMACHLGSECPDKTYTILERRDNIGGTWDLFRYPGIRSDSDMSTFGFSFHPWTGDSFLATGEEIQDYIKDTADEYGITQKIRFSKRVTKNTWSSKHELWTVSFIDEATGRPESLTCKFLIGATGYYDYDKGYQPDFDGMKDFGGTWVHPQFWPKDLDYKDKTVVVIGSGATAVTLVPAMADDTKHITMLQRSPSYVATVPAVDPITKQLRGRISDMSIYRLARARNIAMQRTIYELSQRIPEKMKVFFLSNVKRQLKGKVDMKHFTPSYNPWDQRLCAVPDGDLFRVLRQGKASVVTDHIDKITKTGIQLQSGEHLEADIIISATGLSLQVGGNAEFEIDGKTFDVPSHLTYKGVLVEDLPNAAVIFGYTNSSWTLKADIAAEYVCRLLNHMDKKGYSVVKPIDTENNRIDNTTVFGDMSSGYVRRGLHSLPKQGKTAPWKVTHNYITDTAMLRFSKIADNRLIFSRSKAGEGLIRKGIRTGLSKLSARYH